MGCWNNICTAILDRKVIDQKKCVVRDSVAIHPSPIILMKGGLLVLLLWQQDDTVLQVNYTCRAKLGFHDCQNSWYGQQLEEIAIRHHHKTQCAQFTNCCQFFYTKMGDIRFINCIHFAANNFNLFSRKYILYDCETKDIKFFQVALQSMFCNL